MPDTTYDPEADALYITVGEGLSVETEEVAPNVMLDFDSAGRVVGVEVLTASKVLAPGDWRNARLPGPVQVEAAVAPAPTPAEGASCWTSRGGKADAPVRQAGDAAEGIQRRAED